MKSTIDSKIGIINIFTENEADTLIEKTDAFLGETVLTPGTRTTLNGFFNGDVVYLGIYDEHLQFKIGENSDLFGFEIWTNAFKKINDNRICTVYQLGTARDYIYRNGVWK